MVIQRHQVVKERAPMTSGLEFIIETLGMRYEYDEKGRIIRTRAGGCVAGFPPGLSRDLSPDWPSESLADFQPLFVLGRSAEGCVWRFSANLANDRVIAVARLAARELGFPVRTGTASPPPERLVMIERLLVPDVAELGTRHEILTRDGDAMAELWTMDGAGLGLGEAPDS